MCVFVSFLLFFLFFCFSFLLLLFFFFFFFVLLLFYFFYDVPSMLVCCSLLIVQKKRTLYSLIELACLQINVARKKKKKKKNKKTRKSNQPFLYFSFDLSFFFYLVYCERPLNKILLLAIKKQFLKTELFYLSSKKSWPFYYFSFILFEETNPIRSLIVTPPCKNNFFKTVILFVS